MIGLDAIAFASVEPSGEGRLFKAIVARAAMDAAGKSAATSSRNTETLARRDALNWFKEAGPDYVAVCDLAGLNPGAVRTAVIAYVNGGSSVRRRGLTQRAA